MRFSSPFVPFFSHPRRSYFPFGRAFPTLLCPSHSSTPISVVLPQGNRHLVAECRLVRHVFFLEAHPYVRRRARRFYEPLPIQNSHQLMSFTPCWFPQRVVAYLLYADLPYLWACRRVCPVYRDPPNLQPRRQHRVSVPTSFFFFFPKGCPNSIVFVIPH